MATTINLLTSTTDETGDTHKVTKSRLQLVGQISITGTQTVTLNGRIDSNHVWLPIQSVSASAQFLFTNPGELQVVTTGTSGGSSVTSISY